MLGRTRDTDGGRPDESAEFARALAEPEGAKALMLWVDAAIPVYERTSAIADAGKAAYLSDPDVADWWERSEGLRLAGSARMIQALAEHGMLRWTSRSPLPPTFSRQNSARNRSSPTPSIAAGVSNAWRGG